MGKDKFEEVYGFDEALPVAYNDVKLCFELHEKGYYNVMRNDVVAYHYESLSRGSDQINDRKLLRMNKERERLFAEFPNLKDRDPFLNQNLHHYAAELQLNHCFDKLAEMDLTDCEQTDGAAIDSFNIGDDIRVVGWSLLEGEEHVEELTRYLVFRDPYGRTYGAAVLCQSRPDVVAYFDNANYLHAGFECVLSKAELRVDVLPYLMGVMTIGRTGKRYVCWCKETDVVRTPKPRPVALGSKVLDEFIISEGTLDVNWYIDECQRTDFYYKIRGFAYRRGEDHYRYRKTLILSDDSGMAYEFEVQQEERIDVAYSFAKEPFLYYTGFVCYLFESMLKPDTEYRVAIRLSHQGDPSKVCDIQTGKTVLFSDNALKATV